MERTEAILKTENKLKMLKEAREGKKPVCPVCNKGCIVPKAKGMAYECDNEECGYHILMR